VTYSVRSVDEEVSGGIDGGEISPEALAALAEQASPSMELWEAKQARAVVVTAFMELLLLLLLSEPKCRPQAPMSLDTVAGSKCTAARGLAGALPHSAQWVLCCSAPAAQASPPGAKRHDGTCCC
jgi:hypothetical protein